MGYYHDFGGSITTRNMTTADIKEAEDRMEYCGYSEYVSGEFGSVGQEEEISFSGSCKFYSDDVDAFLSFIAPFTVSGYIQCAGEDGSLWMYDFDAETKSFQGLNGETVYHKDSERVVLLTIEEMAYLYGLMGQAVSQYGNCDLYKLKQKLKVMVVRYPDIVMGDESEK